MVDRANKPSALAQTPGLAPQPIVETTHDNSRVTARLPSGESVEVLLYGATVISWKLANGEEKLWMSDAAKLDGSKAARGGVPIVFPVFGSDPNHAPTSKLPQHGFARISRWEYLGKSTSESAATKQNPASDGGVKLDFGLSASNLDETTKKAWPENFGLIYSVTLSKEGLNASILVRNEGTTPWEFQFLTHTYFRVKDIANVSVNGLKGSSYLDKVGTISTKTETATDLTFEGETDRVYTLDSPSTILTVNEGSKKVLELTRDNLENTVVWNPWIEKSKATPDFEPKDGYKQMLCVEAGQVNGWLKLEGGDTWEGGQFIKAQL